MSEKCSVCNINVNNPAVKVEITFSKGNKTSYTFNKNRMCDLCLSEHIEETMRPESVAGYKPS